MPLAVPSTAPVRRLLDRWLFRLGSPETAPIRLHQRRIYVLPTGAGFGLAASLLVMLIASINYNLSLGFGLTFLLGGIGVASIVHAFRNLFDLSVRPLRGTPVFCGNDARFTFSIENARAARRPALSLRLHGATTRFDLGPAESVAIELVFPTTRRGLLPAGRTVLETRWPLGLIRAWSVFVPDLACTVYPQPEADAPPLPITGFGSTEGSQATRDGDDDFAGLRAYREGDSPRHVAWKALARGGPMLTKHYSGMTGGRALLQWHGLPEGLDEEARLSRLTAWALGAEQAGLLYGLELPGKTITAGRGDAHLHACLRALAMYGPPFGTHHDAI